MDEYIGIIMLWSGHISLIPAGFLPCDGRSLPTDSDDYTALYSIIGNTYGGNSQNFNLPDFRSRIPVGSGNAGPFPVHAGNMGGALKVALSQANLPPHTHQARVNMAGSGVYATTNDAGTGTPSNSLIMGTPGYMNGTTFTPTAGFNMATPDTQLNSNSFAITTPMQVNNADTGSGQPINIMPSYFGLHYIICYQGFYPPHQ